MGSLSKFVGNDHFLVDCDFFSVSNQKLYYYYFPHDIEWKFLDTFNLSYFYWNFFNSYCYWLLENSRLDPDSDRPADSSFFQLYFQRSTSTNNIPTFSNPYYTGNRFNFYGCQSSTWKNFSAPTLQNFQFGPQSSSSPCSGTFK